MTTRTFSSNKPFITTKKSDIVSHVHTYNSDKTMSSSHLDTCKAFKGERISERRKILKETGTCFMCCSTNTHMKKGCKVKIKCSDCDSDYHPTPLHIMNFIPHTNSEAHGGENGNNSSPKNQEVKSMCTQIVCKILSCEFVHERQSSQLDNKRSKQ